MKEQEIINKWAKTGILDGLDDRMTRIAAIMMDNQVCWNKECGGNALFARISVPLIRRLMSELSYLPNLDVKMEFENPKFLKLQSEVFWQRRPVNIARDLKKPKSPINLDRESEGTLDLTELLVEELGEFVKGIQGTICLGWFAFLDSREIGDLTRPNWLALVYG